MFSYHIYEDETTGKCTWEIWHGDDLIATDSADSRQSAIAAMEIIIRHMHQF